MKQGRKRVVYLFVITVVMAACLTGCGQEKVREEVALETTYVYDGITYRMQQIEPLEEPQIMYFEWIEPEAVPLDEWSDLVIKGEVKNIREISLEYVFMESEVTDYGTLFDVEVITAYKTNGVSKDVITVYSPFCSRESCEDVVELKEGAVYYFILADIAKNRQGLYHVADYQLPYAKAFLISEKASEKQVEYLEEVIAAQLDYNASNITYIKEYFTEGNMEAVFTKLFQ